RQARSLSPALPAIRAPLMHEQLRVCKFSLQGPNRSMWGCIYARSRNKSRAAGLLAKSGTCSPRATVGCSRRPALAHSNESVILQCALRAFGPSLQPPAEDIAMDQETFNLSIRRFLKMVGINSQREIEQAVEK